MTLEIHIDRHDQRSERVLGVKDNIQDVQETDESSRRGCLPVYGGDSMGLSSSLIVSKE
jgi:hypothetical protein